MHFRSEDDPQAQELAALIADKGPQAALAQISGPDAASDVVAEAVNDYNAENDAQRRGRRRAHYDSCQICRQ